MVEFCCNAVSYKKVLKIDKPLPEPMPEMINVMEFQWFVTEIMCYMSFPKVPAEILIFFIISLFWGGWKNTEICMNLTKLLKLRQFVAEVSFNVLATLQCWLYYLNWTIMNYIQWNFNQNKNKNPNPIQSSVYWHNNANHVSPISTHTTGTKKNTERNESRWNTNT